MILTDQLKSPMPEWLAGGLEAVSIKSGERKKIEYIKTTCRIMDGARWLGSEGATQKRHVLQRERGVSKARGAEDPGRMLQSSIFPWQEVGCMVWSPWTSASPRRRSLYCRK